MTSAAASDVAATLSAAASALRRARTVLVVSHERPDADALGSSIACAMVAERLGAAVTIFNVDGCPSKLRFLPWSERIVATLDPSVDFDVTVLLDCGQRARAGAAFPPRGWGRTVVCLDHHVTHDPQVADVFVHDVAAAATGEIVYLLAREAGVDVDHDMALALYAAILTDTGSFRYSSTRPESLEIGAALLRTGLDAWSVASAIYESEPLERTRLLAMALGTLEISAGGRLATLALSSEMIAAAGASEEMADGIVNFARAVRGVEVAALLFALPDGTFRANLRSRGAVNVARVAERFGGGGHHNAAGCTVVGPITSARTSLEAALTEVLAV